MTMNETLSPEQEAAFGDWIRKKGIEVALWDFDDTLIGTNALFLRHEQLFFTFVQQFIDEPNFDAFVANYRNLNNQSFQLMGASRTKWKYIIDGLSSIYGHDNLRPGLEIFHSIYEQAPDLLDGARETLEAFERTGIDMGLVTHALPRWTDLKLDTHDLRKYFSDVHVIDTELEPYKLSHHWRQAVDKFGVDPANVMVVGDNVRGDIEASRLVGVMTQVLLPTGWHIYAQGTVPEDVIVAESIGNVIPSILMHGK